MSTKVVRSNTELPDRYDFSPANNLLVPASILGIAQAMLEEVIAGAGRRGVTFTTYVRQADAPVVQHRLADAALNIQTAYLHLMHEAEHMQNSAAAGARMDYLSRARVRGAVGYAIQVLREAADKLMSIGGASGFANTSPLQRQWRDIGIATRHAQVTTDPGLEIYGRALLGLEGNISLFI